MNRRLVVSFRWHSVETPPSRYLAAAERVSRRCARVGGRSVAWGAERYSFEFDPDDFRVVLKTCLDLLSEANTHAVGISARELHYDVEARAWGPALVVAEALVAAAAPGEILLDPEIPEAQLGLLANVGSIPTRVGEQKVEGILLLPGTCPPDGLRPEARRVDDSASTRPPLRGPSSSSRGAAAAKAVLSSMAPSRSRGVESESGTPAVPAPSEVDTAQSSPPAEASSVAPPRSSYLAKEERPSVLEALRSGDPEIMCALAAELRSLNGQELLAKRLESMAELARGEVELGLQGLADAVSASRISGGVEQCQAALAYAVGLAQVGRREQALQETLWGLARAREWADTKGERACCQLAAQLAAAAGHADVAALWRDAAASCGRT